MTGTEFDIIRMAYDAIDDDPTRVEVYDALSGEDDEYWYVDATVRVPKRKPMWVNLRATSEGLRSLRRERPGTIVIVCSVCHVRLPNWLQGMCVECAAKNPSPLPAWAGIAKLWR